MKSPIPYVYRVQRRPKAGRRRWLLSVVPPVGAPVILSPYPSLGRALAAARLLALGGGMVEVRP